MLPNPELQPPFFELALLDEFIVRQGLVTSELHLLFIYFMAFGNTK